MSPQVLRIAVLILPPIQLLDLSPIDLFHMMSKQYLTECNLPRPFIDLGLDDVDIHYVGEDRPSSPNNTDTDQPIKLAEMTSKASIRLTANLSSPQVQPGQINILLIPGPDPNTTPTPAAQAFIRSHAVMTSTTIMSVCTGIFPLGYTGILDGKNVTGPRALISPVLKPKFPKAKWSEKRYEVDETGRLWTSGGITNGQDMVVAYMRREEGGFSRELVDLVCGMADVQDRGREYGRGGAGEGMFWGWLLVRSWARGMGVFGGRGGGGGAVSSKMGGKRDG